jgi:tetratricopeptide (TPR) repeat protein
MSIGIPHIHASNITTILSQVEDDFIEMQKRMDSGLTTGDFSKASSYFFALLVKIDHTFSQQQLLKIYGFLLQLIPHFNEEKFTQLIDVDSGFDYLPKLLALTPNLCEEQKLLALKLGDWFIEKIYSKEWLDPYVKAMPYYAKAIQIADQHNLNSDEVHLKASRLFIQIIKNLLINHEHFKNVLSLARSLGDANKFNSHLKQVQELKFFCSSEEDKKFIESLYDIVDECVQSFLRNTPNIFIEHYRSFLKSRHIFPFQ